MIDALTGFVDASETLSLRLAREIEIKQDIHKELNFLVRETASIFICIDMSVREWIGSGGCQLEDAQIGKGWLKLIVRIRLVAERTLATVQRMADMGLAVPEVRALKALNQQSAEMLESLEDEILDITDGKESEQILNDPKTVFVPWSEAKKNIETA
jgi:hypothetical protein